MTKKYHVAICGASGVVGRKMLQVLHERNFPFETLTLFASKHQLVKLLATLARINVIQH